ncbi:MAG: cytochrome c3 family protein, partial [Desulfobacteraceae bacterium]|nr:cytochrome c3 family protein [Desulfobacteraceae bacterium]
MKRYFVLAFCTAFILIAGGLPIFGTDTTDGLNLPTGEKTLSAPPNNQTKRTPVDFSHSLHFKYSCKACHHQWDRFSTIKSCSTSGCHDQLRPSPAGGKPSKFKKVISLTGAYHRACRGCHRDQLAEINHLKNNPKTKKAAMNRNPGPIACEDCHLPTSGATKNFSESLVIPMGTMTLEAPEGSYAKRSSVEFPHGLHFGQACQDCHHEWDGKSQVQNCTTSDCHDQLESHESTRNIKDPRNTKYFMAAYHNVCIKCHRDILKERKSLEKAGISNEKELPET